MRCATVLLFFLSQSAADFCTEENSISSRSSYFDVRENTQLKGYIVKRFDSPSLLSCGRLCMENSWCTSTNYKMSSEKDGKGTCELNKHDISLINENTNFHNQQGVTFSMLLKVISKMWFGIWTSLRHEKWYALFSCQTYSCYSVETGLCNSDVIREGRQRILWTEQARHLPIKENTNIHNRQGVTFSYCLIR